MEAETSLIGQWLLNIIIAIAIVVIGRIVVKWLVKLIRKLMVRSDLDPILINFSGSIANAVLMLFVFIAALDHIGVDTTSFIAILAKVSLISLAEAIGSGLLFGPSGFT